MINITLPDSSVRQYNEGVTGLEIARSISEGLARNVLAIKVNDMVWDLTRPITSDASIRLFTWDDEEGKATMWHSSAHLMAEAIEQLYPGAKFGIGPDIENGFYYDIDFGDQQISSDDFKKIEDKMLQLAREKQSYVRREVPKSEAIDHFTRKGDEYKLELINDLEDGTISFYESGSFTDLCRGPHLPDTARRFIPIRDDSIHDSRCIWATAPIIVNANCPIGVVTSNCSQMLRKAIPSIFNFSMISKR